MKRYTDFQKDKQQINLTKEELKNIPWTKYKIIVPSEKDKKDIMDSLEGFHNEGFDSDIITMNQLGHEYINGNNIIVDEKLYNKL